ncbi:hypothetical protein [Streptomyces spongiae]|uniref:TetR family transcriptional regulator n=1 Tax=Streptomyces spongiae TaxID=565072 RepID=A0A5N8XS23_9ACTN|nr:hypothetical protein [Streptomyces spongiae]MPY61415.1 hypothetical protein [Streptomyces spongiae]
MTSRSEDSRPFDYGQAERLRTYVTERVLAAPDPRAAVGEYIRAMITFQQANSVRLGEQWVQNWEDLATLLTVGQRTGHFREFDARVMALAVEGAIDAVVAHWLDHVELDLGAAAEELETFTLNAIEQR